MTFEIVSFTLLQAIGSAGEAVSLEDASPQWTDAVKGMETCQTQGISRCVLPMRNQIWMGFFGDSTHQKKVLKTLVLKRPQPGCATKSLNVTPPKWLVFLFKESTASNPML